MKLQEFINNGAVHIGNNDCTVRALATATGKDYVEVMLVLDAAGRRSRRAGFPIYDWLKAHGHTVLGHWFEKAELSTSGTYLVGNQGHVWVVKNGVMHDSWNSGRRYKYCYRVHKIAEHEAEATPAEQRASALIAASLAD